jgi:hypothetical protein
MLPAAARPAQSPLPETLQAGDKPPPYARGEGDRNIPSPWEGEGW